MEKEKLQNRILDTIGYVAFPENIIEQTIIKLQQKQYRPVYAEKFNQYVNSLHDPLFILAARKRKYFSICCLSQGLLAHYTTEAIPCLILHQYFYALLCEMEKNLTWYSRDVNHVFEVKPSPELRTAEDKLFNYLMTETVVPAFKLQYRHLLSIWYLFPDYMVKTDLASAFISKLNEAEINLKLN